MKQLKSACIKKRIPRGIRRNRQRALFTGARPAISAAGVLNFCVRDGYRCLHSAIAAGSLRSIPQNRMTASDLT